MPDLQYPIGKFAFPNEITADSRKRWIDEISAAPSGLRDAVAGLSDEQLDTEYRPGGWTVRQVVHHLPDSHMNSYCRFKLALAEDEPAVKSYDENRWAQFADARSAPVEPSLSLLESLHKRWVMLLRSLDQADWRRAFRHSDLGLVTLERNLALYAWHGKHHIAHITELRRRMPW